MEPEKTIWDGHPSQIINFPFFFLMVLLAAAFVGGAILFHDRFSTPVVITMGGLAIIPVLIALWRWIETKCHRYELTSERVNLAHGVFSRRTDVLELYRVKDYIIVEPFIYRIFGLGDVVLTTSDDANPKVTLRAVPGVKTIRDEIRKYVELCRTQKGVRIAELE